MKNDSSGKCSYLGHFFKSQDTFSGFKNKKKRVYGNHREILPWDLKKCPRQLYLSLLLLHNLNCSYSELVGNERDYGHGQILINRNTLFNLKVTRGLLISLVPEAWPSVSAAFNLGNVQFSVNTLFHYASLSLWNIIRNSESFSALHLKLSHIWSLLLDKHWLLRLLFTKTCNDDTDTFTWKFPKIKSAFEKTDHKQNNLFDIALTFEKNLPDSLKTTNTELSSIFITK